MTTSPEQLARVIDALEPLPVTSRRLFGEYALYLDGRIPAFVINGELAVKITEVTDEHLTPELIGPIYPGSSNYWRIPMEFLSDRDWLHELLQETTALIAPPKPRKPKTPSGTATGAAKITTRKKTAKKKPTAT